MAWYGPEHAERIAEIRSLQRKGLTSPRSAGWSPVSSARPTPTSPPRSRLRVTLRAAARERRRRLADARRVRRRERRSRLADPGGGARGHPARPSHRRRGSVHGGRHRARADGAAAARVRAAAPELLGLARDADRRCAALAERAVDLFDEHVRKPIRDTAGDDGEHAATQMVEAFSELLPAVTTLVSHHFRRVLLETAEAHIEEPEVGSGRRSRPRRERAASPGQREARGRPRSLRLDLPPLRPGQPRDDVRHGHGVAAPSGLVARAARTFARGRPRLRNR